MTALLTLARATIRTLIVLGAGLALSVNVVKVETALAVARGRR